MIPKLEFGRTGHQSTRVIFCSWALYKATQNEAASFPQNISQRNGSGNLRKDNGLDDS